MTPRPEQAVVLVGGLGTRLRPLTYQTPKALLPVVNRPLLSYELEWLGRAGVRQVILAVAYQAEALEAGLGDGAPWGVELVYVPEREALDTAGALKNCAPYLQGRFWALNGDLIFDFDPAPLVAAHVAAEAALTLTLRRVEDISPFGLIQRGRRGARDRLPGEGIRGPDGAEHRQRRHLPDGARGAGLGAGRGLVLERTPALPGAGGGGESPGFRAGADGILGGRGPD